MNTYRNIIPWYVHEQEQILWKAWIVSACYWAWPANWQQWLIANARLALSWHIQITVRKRCMFHLIPVWRHCIRCRMHIKFLEQGLIVLQVASTSMETQDTHKYILVVQQVAHFFYVFDMGMLENMHKGRKSVEQTMYTVQKKYISHMYMSVVWTCMYPKPICMYHVQK